MGLDAEREWFTLWFNSPYYHILYKYRDGAEARRFLGNLKIELNMRPPAQVLDVACGEGRFSRLLAEEGHLVKGIDIAEENIQIAKKAACRKLSFFQHDMRKPFPFDPASFDFAFNFFTSFGYFESRAEHQQTLENISAVLRVGGECLIDFMNVKKLKHSIRPVETKTIDGVTFKLKRSLSQGEVIKRIQVVAGQKPPLYFEERVKAFTLEDFEILLLGTPLEIIKTYGDYDLNPFQPERSDRLIIRAIKR